MFLPLGLLPPSAQLYHPGLELSSAGTEFGQSTRNKLGCFPEAPASTTLRNRFPVGKKSKGLGKECFWAGHLASQAGRGRVARGQGLAGPFSPGTLDSKSVPTGDCCAGWPGVLAGNRSFDNLLIYLGCFSRKQDSPCKEKRGHKGGYNDYEGKPRHLI